MVTHANKYKVYPELFIFHKFCFGYVYLNMYIYVCFEYIYVLLF